MRRILAPIALVLALLLVPLATPARGLTRLYSKTSTAGGSLDTGALATTTCSQIVVLATATGAAAAAAYTVQACTSSSTSSCAAFGVTLTAPGVGATTDSGSMGPGSASARGVPPFLRYQITGGAASTATLSVYCQF